MSSRSRSRRARRSRRTIAISPRTAGIAAVLLAAAVAGAAWTLDPGRRAQQHLARGAALIDTRLPEALVELKTAATLAPDDPAIQFQLGRAFLAARDGLKARKALEQARALGHDAPDLELLRVEALLLERDYAQAIASVPADGTHASGSRWLMLRGQAELASARPEAAWTTFSRILDQDPSNPEARRGMARVALAEGDVGGAERQIEQAIAASDDDVRTWLLKGDLELAMRRFSAAETSYRRAVELDAGAARPRAGLVRALLAQDRTDDAAQHVAALRERHPNSFTALYLDAELARQRDDLARARATLRRLLKARPEHAPSVLLMAEIDGIQGAHEAVVERLGLFLATRPEHVPARRLLAASLLKTGHARQAVDTLSPALELAANDGAVHHLIGAAYTQLNDHERARRHLQRARELAPDAAPVRAQLALARISAGHSEDAVAALGSATDAGDVNARALLVLALVDEGRTAEALDTARAVAQARPDSARARNLLGAALEAAGHADAARDAFRSAAELDPAYLTPRFNLARVARAAGDLGTARDIYESVLREHEQHPMALVGLAWIAGREARPTRALELLERARRANPGAVAPRLVLASWHLRRGNAAAALEVSREAVRSRNDDPGALRALGIALLASGDTAEAIDVLTHLVRLQPRSADAHFRLALAYEAAGDPAPMRRALEAVLALDPDHRLARVGVANHDLLRGDTAAALATARDIVARDPDDLAGHLLLAETLTALGRPAQALAAYRQAYALSPNGLTVKRLHDGLLRAGLGEEALALLSGWLAERPSDVAGRLLLAQDLEQLGQTQLARIEYERVLYEQPAHPMALNNLAWLYHAAGDPRALEMAERAYAELPSHPQVADTYGWMLFAAGRVQESLAPLDRAHSMLPADPSIRYHRAAALAASGQRRRARDELEALLAAGRPFDARDEARALLARLR